MEEDDNLEPDQDFSDNLVSPSGLENETESVQGGAVDKVEPIQESAKVELVEDTVETDVVSKKRGKSTSHTTASPFVVEGVVRRRTRSTLSESEPVVPVVGLTPGRKPKKSETEPTASSTPSRRSKKPETVEKIVTSAEPDLPEVEPEIQTAKGTTPARSRKFEGQSSEDMDEGPAPVSIIDDSTPVASPSRRLRKGETLKELVPSTPEPKQDVTPLTDSAAR